MRCCNIEELIYDYEKGICHLKDLYGFIYKTKITFVEEKIDVIIDSNGETTFLDSNNHILNQITVIAISDNDKHSSCFCKLKDHKIEVYFPLIKCIDHYPHCDGEYDRYSYIRVGNRCVSFDIDTYEIEIREERNV